jgi:predicted RNase H-like nuclease
VRAALDPSLTYKAACDANKKQCGLKLSKQTYAIIPKIYEVDKLLRASADLSERVYEVHPEVSFYYWNGKKPMQYSKRCGFGFLERYKLVEKEFPGAALQIRKEHKRSDVADDDILDAIAVVWTARRIHMKEHECIPEGLPERDDKGLPIQMRA